MDERKIIQKLIKVFLMLITGAFATIFLTGCATCEPYIASNRCHHQDWIPDHYQGHCFVPGHNLCYVGTSSCIGPFEEGSWKNCGYWKSGHYTCGGYHQRWRYCKELQCETCYRHVSMQCPRWTWYRSYNPNRWYPSHWRWNSPRWNTASNWHWNPHNWHWNAPRWNTASNWHWNPPKWNAPNMHWSSANWHNSRLNPTNWNWRKQTAHS